MSSYGNKTDQAIVAAIQQGLPLVSRPYAGIARRLGMTEAEVLACIDRLQTEGVIKRMGVVVRHHELGYRANAMVVWDVPDDRVTELGNCFSQYGFITLCYRRPRRLPLWRYNLFCMIHGQDRAAVMSNLQHLINRCEVEDIPHEVLFSRRRFKQRGAIYVQQREPGQGHVARSNHGSN
jgi:DNA-binding Lrp family transcriptional regulator